MKFWDPWSSVHKDNGNFVILLAKIFGRKQNKSSTLRKEAKFLLFEKTVYGSFIK